MTKMTYVNAIEMAINGNVTEEVVEKLNALKAQLEKRNSKKATGMTKTQKENVEIKAHIVEILGNGEAKQCKAIAEEIGISGQKCSALLGQLIKEGKAEKFVEKRVTYFKAV